MIIVAHRGFWQQAGEKNSEAAFARALERGYGIETDFRDQSGELVISHDLPRGSCLKAARFFELHARIKPDAWLAINVKADGLQELLAAELKRHNVKNYFLFDSSVADALRSLKSGLTVFTRQSEVETAPAYYDRAAGVWMDEFEGHWIRPADARAHLGARKKVCVVSPELHGRAGHEAVWKQYRDAGLKEDDFMICTDFPTELEELYDV